MRGCNGGRQALEAAARAHPLDVVDAVDAEEHALPRELRAELGDAAAHRRRRERALKLRRVDPDRVGVDDERVRRRRRGGVGVLGVGVGGGGGHPCSQGQERVT